MLCSAHAHNHDLYYTESTIHVIHKEERAINGLNKLFRDSGGAAPVEGSV